MANCCICGKSPAKCILSGLNGKVCTDCQKNISNIRTGKIEEAKAYFDNIDIASSISKQFVLGQYVQYADAANRNAVERDAKNALCLQEESVKKAVKDMLLSTTSTLDGYQIIEYIDVVYSETIYKLSISKSLSTMISDAADSLKIFSNTELSGTTQLLQEAKDYVKRDLMRKAALLGANAIVGIDIESTVGSDGIAKASINGTAVVIKKVES